MGGMLGGLQSLSPLTWNLAGQNFKESKPPELPGNSTSYTYLAKFSYGKKTRKKAMVEEGLSQEGLNSAQLFAIY